MVFKDQRGFAMLFNFQNSIDSVCFCFHAHRINTDLKIEQHSKTTLFLKNQFSRERVGVVDLCTLPPIPGQFSTRQKSTDISPHSIFLPDNFTSSWSARTSVDDGETSLEDGALFCAVRGVRYTENMPSDNLKGETKKVTVFYVLSAKI